MIIICWICYVYHVSNLAGLSGGVFSCLPPCSELCSGCVVATRSWAFRRRRRGRSWSIATTKWRGVSTPTWHRAQPPRPRPPRPSRSCGTPTRRACAWWDDPGGVASPARPRWPWLATATETTEVQRMQRPLSRAFQPLHHIWGRRFQGHGRATFDPRPWMEAATRVSPGSGESEGPWHCRLRRSRPLACDAEWVDVKETATCQIFVSNR